MQLENAKKRVLDLWRTERKAWQQDDYISFFQSARTFYDKLTGTNGILFSGNGSGDKWQMVSRWLHEYEGYLRY